MVKEVLISFAMKFEVHDRNATKIVEIKAEGIIIHTAEEGLQLLVDCYYQNFDKLILYEQNITPKFFNLKSGLAGELLQKFSNYRVQLVIIGEFKHYPSSSLKDFIFESNKGKQVNFLPTLKEAIDRLS